MYLEKLEINGFKSFAHKTILEFKPGITAIVGPNGSGKSNCADAVRWVLGEQSIKLLRGKKSEDVIFSGSDKKARLGMAEVSLYFNNNHDKANLGMGEICLTRRLYRNGESEYLINKQKARLLDIQMLLAKAGVAHTSYAIIGQGMIDAFLLASKEDRKEFFEEASGVKPLRIKREQTLSKLESTEDNLATAKVQLGEIEPHLNSLTRQVKKIQQRAELEKDWQNLSFKYYGSLWSGLDAEYKILHEAIVKIASAEKEAREKMRHWQTELARLTKDSVESDEINKLSGEYQEILASKMSLHEKITNWRLKQAENNAGQVRKEPHLPFVLGQEINNLTEELKKQIVNLKQAWINKNEDEFNKIFTIAEELVSKINQLLTPFIKKNDATLGKNNTPEDKFKEYELAIFKIDQEIKNIQEKIRIQGQKAKEERAQIWQVQENYQFAQKELNEITNSLNNKRMELVRLETRREDLVKEIEQELKISVSQISADFLVGNLSDEERDNIGQQIDRLKHQLALIGGIDPSVANEYETVKERHDFLATQTADLLKSMGSLEKLILELDETIKKQFESSFKIIDEEFQKYFRLLFAGGKARLVLVKAEALEENLETENISSDSAPPNFKDEQHLESEKIRQRLKSDVYLGVEIEATPPGKKLKSINMLSGGERAMSSIALICAIISANPSPFVVLDEVDAALDEANSLRYADILDQLAHQSQFIVITHNRASMEKAGILYGVTMGADGVSALLSLQMEHAEKYTNR